MKSILYFILIGIVIIGGGCVISTLFFPNVIIFFTEPNTELKNSFGILGDYIGGIFGTIFTFITTICLIYTLNTQLKETERGLNVFKHQQFNNVFFGLLRLYEQYESNLVIKTDKGIEKRGKNSFTYMKELMSEKFKSKDCNFNIRHKNAIECYVDIYIKYMPLLGSYFRIIYRIFDLVSNADISDSEKVKYAKIMRSQFSEDELLLLYYDSCSDYGHAFIKYIKEFNILKHLPVCNKLEFITTKELDNQEIYSIQLVIQEIIDYLRVNNCGEFYKAYLKGRNSIKIERIYVSKLKIYIIEKKSVKTTDFLQSGKGLEKFSAKEISNLVIDVLMDYYLYNNHDIKIKDSKTENLDSKTTIITEIEI